MPTLTLSGSGGGISTNVPQIERKRFLFLIYTHFCEFIEVMEQIWTLVVRLDVSEDQHKLLADTASAFASACNWINETVNSNLTNRNSIQAVCYRDVKTKFGLTSNHVVRACGRVGANRLTAKQKGRKVKGFKPTSFDCDARTFRFIEENWSVSISTTGKRATIPLKASNYHRGKLSGQEPTSAQVCLPKKTGVRASHLQGDFYSINRSGDW